MPTETCTKPTRVKNDFYAALAAALELAGAYVWVASPKGRLFAPRWLNCRVDLCPPFRVRIRWNPPDRPRKTSFAHCAELGAADEQALLGMIPDLVARLIDERFFPPAKPSPALQTKQRFFREAGEAFAGAGIPWRVLSDGFFLYVRWPGGKALLDPCNRKWYIDVDAGGKRFSLEAADENELLAYVPRLVAFARGALSARELAGAAKIRY
jgi:hypothetical protein